VIAMKFKPSIRRSHKNSRHSEQGYVLLTLLLIVTLLIIAATVALPTITFEIKRDKEEEMIHRGAQYSRAIRAYYKKLGRYPSKIEDLENTNNIRFLRKRYKDPLTGKDFKLLHFGEAQMMMGGIGGGGIAGATPVSAMNGPNGSGGAFGQTSGPGNGGLLGNSASANSANQPNGQDTNNQTGDQNANGDSSQQAQPASPGGLNSISSSNLTSQTFGGAPIVGVASLSKKETIREFNHKKKYNEWQFIYDPSMDRGGIINTPYQPALMTFANQNLNGNGQGNTNGNSFGQSPLGQSPGMNNGPGFGNQNGFGNSNPQQNQPQQPQQNDIGVQQ